MADKKKSTSAARTRKPAGGADTPLQASPVDAAAPKKPTTSATPAGLPAPAASTPAAASKPAAKPATPAQDAKAAAKARTARSAELAAAPATAATPVAAATSPTKRMPTHDEIARRAHAIHRERGGSAFDNWLQAERELRG